uniref:thiamine pyrophosphate-dependent enzyme n=1 Tax=Salmonella sp. s54925 TaxID=3159674 RepID=UPI0039810331
QAMRKNQDTIANIKDKILSTKLATADELKAIDQEIKSVIEEAVKQAKSDKEIPLDELYKDVYSTGMQGHPMRGCDLMTSVNHN